MTWMGAGTTKRYAWSAHRVGVPSSINSSMTPAGEQPRRLECSIVGRSTEKRSPIPPPAVSGPLRPFVVRRPRWVWWTSCVISAMLLIATVGCVVLGAVSANMGAYLGAGACALVLLLLFGPLTYSVVTYRLIVDPRGIHRVVRGRTGSIPWQQLADVTIERVKTGDVYGDELFLITPTGKVGPMGPAGLKSGLLHQLQATILSYRDRIRVGNAHWESTVGDGAISYPRDRELSGSSPPDRNIWEKTARRLSRMAGLVGAPAGRPLNARFHCFWRSSTDGRDGAIASDAPKVLGRRPCGIPAQLDRSPRSQQVG